MKGTKTTEIGYICNLITNLVTDPEDPYIAK